jgi:hypothetical protein
MKSAKGTWPNSCGLRAALEDAMRKRCVDCKFWKRGYRLQGMKVPDFCDKHFHSQSGDDPACTEFSSIVGDEPTEAAEGLIPIPQGYAER